MSGTKRIDGVVATPCLLLAAFSLGLGGLTATPADAGERQQRPNILWITCEDISPSLGCYGDAYAVTPNLDRLALQGVRYTAAFAPIGVCAPSRSSLITGMYAPSIGTHHMRCHGTLPESVKCFTEYLRQAGYYCTNNVKTDYNFTPSPSAWDESSGKAHWHRRKPGQPFFSVFNFVSSHESQIRLSEDAYRARTAHFTPAERHDPARAVVPVYHPDTPEVRRDWARYADMITYMDKQVADLLGQLEADGLNDDTIVFFFSDHGAGMPRSKRWLYDSSLRVPFILRFPKKFQDLAPSEPGSTADRLVSFVDFGPTVLSLAGVPVPQHMQGKAFLGRQAGEPRRYVYGFRDRMDERYDLLRAVRDHRYKYIRNYMPHLPYFHHQYISYMYEMPTMQVWQRLADQGKLSGPPAVFMARTKPVEELYDTLADSQEVNNLAGSEAHQAVLAQMHTALRQWMDEIIDLGLLPEADLRTRFRGLPEYDAVRRQPALFPFERIAETADLASRRNRELLPELCKRIKDPDPAVRFWAATGLGAFEDERRAGTAALVEALTDASATVRVAAADGLCRLKRLDAALPVLIEGLRDPNEWVRLQAANVLDRIGDRAVSTRTALQAAAADTNSYVVRVVEHALNTTKR